MRNYIGTYRVICERDDNGNITDRDNLYIACAKDRQIYRYSKNFLAYEGTRVMATKLCKLYPECKVFVEAEDATVVLFPESLLPELAQYMKPRTGGRNISPWSEKHYNPNYVKPELSAEQLKHMESMRSKSPVAMKNQ